jgi:hypothetical protein
MGVSGESARGEIGVRGGFIWRPFVVGGTASSISSSSIARVRITEGQRKVGMANGNYSEGSISCGRASERARGRPGSGLAEGRK